MLLNYARYTLQFKHPFGTAHGLRTGTASIFIRLDHGDHSGYGEATLPPYLAETQDSIIQELITIAQELPGTVDGLVEPGTRWPHLSEPASGVLSTAFNDLKYKILNRQYSSSIESNLDRLKQRSMVTIGQTELDEVEQHLADLPHADIVKVKLGDKEEKIRLARIMSLDRRDVFLDANQGWSSIEHALAVLEDIDPRRLVGIEQPFAKAELALHRALGERCGVPVYGDESLQDELDLDHAKGAFAGVNVKLMKCGGLEAAERIISKARSMGLKVMLGCMSESSLGCGAMANLAPLADLIDLDGPWLINNDPFMGMAMEHGRIVLGGTPGLGIIPKPGAVLDWTPIGA